MGLGVLRQTKKDLTHEKHQRSAAEQGANNLSDQLKSAGENYAHSQAELGRVKNEKEGVVARLERNKRDLNRKEQQLYEMKVELSGEKKVRAAAEQKANSLSDQLNSARKNYVHSQEELRHMKREKDSVVARLSQAELRHMKREKDDDFALHWKEQLKMIEEQQTLEKRQNDRLKRAQEILTDHQAELVEVRKKRHEIATTMTTCEEKLRKPEWQLDALNEELHQLRDCKKHWERIFNDTLNKGVFNVSNQGVCSNQLSNFFKN